MENISGFIRQDGENIVDGSGSPILLRGVGLGNWLLPEGYMWKFYEACDRPRRIEALMRELIGNEAEGFWEDFRKVFISERDIEYITEYGLNSVRLAMNARQLMQHVKGEFSLNESGFEPIDRLIGLCKPRGVYIILDMHGAPGGQTGANIDDCEDDYPRLFTDEERREELIWLWGQIAKRYKDETCIAGYDLLNEPLPEWFSRYNNRVMPLYRDIADEIRTHDNNHMLILEGVHWATDWSIFDELETKPMENIMLQFHKYWNETTYESIETYDRYRERLGLPIYMGEGGENELEWYAACFGMLEQHNISWNLWTYKKMDCSNSPVTIDSPKDWDAVLAYIKGEAKPENASEIVRECLYNIKNARENHDVMRYATRTGL